MADLSIASEATDWAWSYIHEERLGALAFVRRSPGSARKRIQSAIAELSADQIQAKRCADGIAALHAVLELQSRHPEVK